MAEVDPVDPRPYIEESCKPNCVKPLLQYKACGKRVEADETGHKHCTGQFLTTCHALINVLHRRYFPI